MAYMKRLARLAIAILLVTGCTKKQGQAESVSIVGKWELIETYWSIGGPGN
jgi:PBP1b-binding outer membrane lipoprotein LpoB